MNKSISKQKLIKTIVGEIESNLGSYRGFISKRLNQFLNQWSKKELKNWLNNPYRRVE